MAHLVGDDIRPCKITGRAIPVKLFKEVEVQIDFPILWAIERSHGRHSAAAGRLCAAGEQHQFWVLVATAMLAKLRAPDILRCRQYFGCEYCHFVAKTGSGAVGRISPSGRLGV